MTPTVAPDDSALLRAQAASQRGFYRALAGGSLGARLEEWPGVQATVVPVRPWFSIFNSVLFTDADALEEVLPEIAERYKRHGVNAWRVWVPPYLACASACLERAGYTQAEATPCLMAAFIGDLDLDQRTALEIQPSPTWQTVAAVNDSAYGILEPYTTAAAFSTIDDPATRLHVACRDGRPASALLARERDGDCYFWFVATVAEARGLGLAGELMRHALRDALTRGCRTTTLESSAMGESVYAGLGFRRLGRFQIKELMHSTAPNTPLSRP